MDVIKCPKCGAKVKINTFYDISKYRYWGSCTKCNYRQHEYFDSEVEVVKSWGCKYDEFPAKEVCRKRVN